MPYVMLINFCRALISCFATFLLTYIYFHQTKTKTRTKNILQDMENLGPFLMLVVKLWCPIVFGILYWLGPTGWTGISKCLCLVPIVYAGPLSLYSSGLYRPGPGGCHKPFCFFVCLFVIILLTFSILVKIKYILLYSFGRFAIDAAGALIIPFFVAFAFGR